MRRREKLQASVSQAHRWDFAFSEHGLYGICIVAMDSASEIREGCFLVG